MRTLILGGTGEARELAAVLSARADVEVISSLAGRVRDPVLPVGEVLIGGFGGAPGLTAFLRHREIDVLVDATHPFAVRISANAALATARTGVPLLTLRRPGWTMGPGDHWVRVPDIATAARTVRGRCPPGSVVLLTTGRRDLAPFAADPDRHYLVRAVDPPEIDLPPIHTVVLDRGPYTVAGETELLRAHDVAVLVTKDSGGTLTSAKLAAARALRLPVVMVDRPVQHGPTSPSVPDLLEQLRGLGPVPP